jgi:membrane protease YdiL (CAAX protease family)
VIALIPDRSPKEAALALAATWLAFCLALSLALPQPPNPAHLALGAAVGAVLILLGFSTASRCRPFLRRSNRERARLAVLSLLAGVVLGGALVALLTALARAEPALRARFAGRLGESAWRPWALAFESSILEEVAFRLFAMGLVAWIVARLLKRPGAAFATALLVSTLLFALAHFPAWASAAAHPSAALLGSVLLLNALAGLGMGWIFWRWGLVYAILCHLAGDAVVQSLGPKLLA